jgi:hypothetical protein
MKLVLLLSLIAVAFAANNVRLVNKDGKVVSTEGRVEVLLNGKWGQVCGDGFITPDAQVVCRSIGRDGYGAPITGQHGIGSYPIVMTNLNCNGDETNIFSCTYRRQSTCQGGIAAVDCQAGLVGTTGSIGLEAGIIAAIVICLVAIVGVVVLLIGCLWRNDFCMGGRITG